MARRQSGLIALTLGLLVAAQVLPGFRATTPSPAEGHSLVASPSAQHAAIASNYGQLPLSFELNAGQTDPSVRFLTHGGGYSLFLTPNSAVMTLGGGADVPARHNALRLPGMPAMSTATQPAAVVGMQWLGANQYPVITGERPLPGTVNYFTGNDPATWRTNIPTYQQVRYHDVYPGIDLVYYGNQGQLEYDFVVAPGADPAPIALGFTGTRQVGVDLLGNLSLTLPGGALQQAKPLIYQTMNGARHTVAGGYALTGSGRVGFALGAYNPHLPLVIDPAYKFSTYVGDNGGSEDIGMAVDSVGNVYVAGAIYGTTFPAPGAVHQTFGQMGMAFAKINAAGTAVLYLDYIGGSSAGAINSVAVDKGGDAYLTGFTGATDFPLTPGAYQTTMKGSIANAFVSEVNATGTTLVLSTYLGGSFFDSGDAITADGSGNAYVFGDTQSSDFPTVNAVQSTNGGGFEDTFVSKVNATGTALVYSTYLGGSGDDTPGGIAVDSGGNAFLAGSTQSANFPTVSPLQVANGGSSDAFVSKLSANGSSLAYSTYLGGTGDDFGSGITIDTSGNAYIAGQTASTNFPVANAIQATFGGGSGDEFVTELNTAGSSLIYSTYLGGSNYDAGISIAIDNQGNTFVVGVTSSTDFPTANALQLTYGGGSYDATVSKLAPNGSALLYSSYLGGNDFDFPFVYGAIGLDAGDDVYVGGKTYSTNFPTKNAGQPALTSGNEGAFITKLSLRPSVNTTTGVFRPSNGALYLKNANTTGPADIALYYGLPGDQPITGDWTGKGYKSIGIFRSGTFYLRNSNTTGFADIVVPFGNSTDIPVAGDWTGKGYDSIGVYRPSTNTFLLRNSNTGGPANITARLGIAGDVSIVGDWTGKGFDSIGVFRPSNGIVYLRNSNTTGVADINFVYGIAGDKPVVGDWDANGTDTIGVDRTGNFLLRNSNTTGPANLSFYLGVSGDDPIAGPWLAPSSSPPPVQRGPSGGNTPTTRASSSAVAPRGRYTMP